jgi:hypothetical protein
MEDEFNPHSLPETTATEIIDKIEEMTQEIHGDWSDPRSECREIYRLLAKLKEIL